MLYRSWALHKKIKKVRTLIYRKVAYLPALAVGSAAQLATIHCPNIWILDPQSAARQFHLCPSQPQCGRHPSMFSGSDSLFLVASITMQNCRYYQVADGWSQWQLDVVFDSADTRGRHQLPASQASADQYHTACTGVFHSWWHQVAWGTLVVAVIIIIVVIIIN